MPGVQFRFKDDEIASRLGFKAEEYAAIRAAEEWARSFSDQKRQELARKGWALPDGSYPIETKEDLANAMTLARSGHGDVGAAMRLIRRRANDLGVKLDEKGAVAVGDGSGGYGRGSSSGGSVVGRPQTGVPAPGGSRYGAPGIGTNP